jgi:DNA-binding protein HU-beta
MITIYCVQGGIESMNIMNRTKKDIAAAVADQTGMTKKDSEAAVNAVFETITETLKDGGEVSIAGFGKFVVAEKPARQGINPATGEKIEIAASRAPKFKAAKTLKDELK